VDASVEQIVVRAGKVRRSLKIHTRHEQARDGNGAQHFSVRWFGPMAHGDFGLHTEILDDDFLNVAVAVLQIANGEQGIYAVFEAFADSDEQSRGEWNALFASIFYCAQALGRTFVGSVVVGGVFIKQ